MIQRFLKITSAGKVEHAKNERQYMTVKFKAENQRSDGTPVLSSFGEASRTVFQAFEDKSGNTFKADPLFDQLISGEAKVGMLIEGQIVKVKTTPYKIPGSKFDATSYTCVVFAGEDPITYINKQLKTNYACVIDGDNITAYEQTIRPVGAPVQEERVEAL